VRDHERGVGQRLVEVPGQRGQNLGDLGSDDELAMVAPDRLGDRPGGNGLAEARLLEVQGEGANRRARRDPAHQRHDGGRVEAAREEHAERDVAHEVPVDAVGEGREHPVFGLSGRGDQAGGRLRAPVLPEPGAPFLEHEPLPGRELPHARERRGRRRDVEER